MVLGIRLYRFAEQIREDGTELSLRYFGLPLRVPCLPVFETLRFGSEYLTVGAADQRMGLGC